MKYLLPLSILFMAFTACNSSKRINKDFLYFQHGLDSMGKVQFKEPAIKVNDLLSVQIYSNTPNQDQTRIFNMLGGGSSSSSGSSGGESASSTSAVSNSGYLVDGNGYITIPVIGNVKALGLTRLVLADTIARRVKPYVVDPGVQVRFLQFKVNVLGEVKNPGSKSFDIEHVTLLDAIGAAGDLTDKGKREDILVIRDENGNRKYYQADLRDANLFHSPAFQLMQNDIVYVGATKNKLKEINVDPASQRNLQTGISILSAIAIIVSLINLTK